MEKEKEKIEKKERVNVLDILRYCPIGIKLDSPCFDDLIFTGIYGESILCSAGTGKNKYKTKFNKYGCICNSPTAKCVIFPQDKNSWDGFKLNFKDGDIVTWSDGTKDFVFIWKEIGSEENVSCYCGVVFQSNLFVHDYSGFIDRDSDQLRPATKEEIEKIFNVINLNGYSWDKETKILEKNDIFSLILEDLSSRLPYEFKVFEIGYGICTVKGLFFDNSNGWLLEVEGEKSEKYQISMSKVKPLLYPLSTLKEDQLRELTLLILRERYSTRLKEVKWKSFKFLKDHWLVSLGLVKSNVDKKHIDRGITETEIDLKINLGHFNLSITREELVWFSKNQVDFRGLIPLGIAWDANKLGAYLFEGYEGE